MIVRNFSANLTVTYSAETQKFLTEIVLRGLLFQYSIKNIYYAPVSYCQISDTRGISVIYLLKVIVYC